MPEFSTKCIKRIRDLLTFLKRDAFCRYIIVGGINTAFSFLLYASIILLGVDYRITLTICTLITIVFNFSTYSRLVFNNKRKRLILKFVLVYGFIYVVNQGSLIWLVTHGVGELISQAILLPLIVTISFVLNRKWVFREALESCTE